MKPKIVTGAKATLKINGKPVLYASDVLYGEPYDIKRCSCQAVKFPAWAAARHHVNLINLLHKLMHQ